MSGPLCCGPSKSDKTVANDRARFGLRRVRTGPLEYRGYRRANIAHATTIATRDTSLTGAS